MAPAEACGTPFGRFPCVCREHHALVWGSRGRRRVRFLWGEVPRATRGQQLPPPIPSFRLGQGLQKWGAGGCLAGVLCLGGGLACGVQWAALRGPGADGESRADAAEPKLLCHCSPSSCCQGDGEFPTLPLARRRAAVQAQGRGEAARPSQCMPEGCLFPPPFTHAIGDPALPPEARACGLWVVPSSPPSSL